MSLESLESTTESTVFRTEGKNWREHTFIFGNTRGVLGDVQIERLMRRFFGAKIPVISVPVTCWYDEDIGYTKAERYYPVNGVHIVGVLWKPAVNNADIQVPSHFFVRKLVDYRAPLSDWRHDVKIPSNIHDYSVCAILDDSFQWDSVGLHDSENSAVRQFRAGALKRYGIDFDVLREWVAYETSGK